jgi:phospholipase/carboxylesterase
MVDMNRPDTTGPDTNGAAGDMAGVLAHEVYVPQAASDGVPVLVLLHGRGADRTDLFGLRRQMPAEWAVVAPDAPFPAAPWGYGPGRAWYRYLGGNRPDPSSFTESLAALDRLLGALPAVLGVAPGPVALGGFSQGGTMSVGHALSRPGRVRHILNFSGFVADHPDISVTADRVAGARFFWGHGTHDPAIPFVMGLEGRRALEQAGAELEARDYDIGHWIDPEELSHAIAWLQRGFGEAQSG